MLLSTPPPRRRGNAPPLTLSQTSEEELSGGRASSCHPRTRAAAPSRPRWCPCRPCRTALCSTSPRAGEGGAAEVSASRMVMPRDELRECGKREKMSTSPTRTTGTVSRLLFPSCNHARSTARPRVGPQAPLRHPQVCHSPRGLHAAQQQQDRYRALRGAGRRQRRPKTKV